MKGSIQTVQGNILREQRKKTGRTLRSVAWLSKVSMSYLSEVEKGKKQASEDILGAITPWYNITVPELLRETADRLEVNVNAG